MPCSQGFRQLSQKVGMTIQNNILEVLVNGSWRHFSVKYCIIWQPQMDDIVGKTCQTYDFFYPCQEIDIQCHKPSQNGNFVSKISTFGHRRLATLFSGLCGPEFLLAPDSGPDAESSPALTWSFVIRELVQLGLGDGLLLCLVTIKEALWHSLEGSFMGKAEDISHFNVFENCSIAITLPRGQLVSKCQSGCYFRYCQPFSTVLTVGKGKPGMSQL